MEYLGKYSILTMIIILLELIYFPIAKHFKIGSEVTPRSSHNEFIISGAGFIFYISAILFFFIFGNNYPVSFPKMLIGATILAIISFYDDVKNLTPILRFIIQIIVVAITFNQLFINEYYDIYLLLLICGVGFINAFNFMDGINGILAGYTFVSLVTILFCYSNIYNYQYSEYYISFIIVLIISTIIFSILNFRKRAKCFAGDVGAIVMGFFILFLMSELILTTSEASLIIFLIVYAIDSVFTILQRLFAGENIFLPHRLHLYQLLANQCKIDHYKVAIGYSVLQLIINAGYFFVAEELKWTYCIIVTSVLIMIYFSLKRYLRHKL